MQTFNTNFRQNLFNNFSDETCWQNITLSFLWGVYRFLLHGIESHRSLGFRFTENGPESGQRRSLCFIISCHVSNWLTKSLCKPFLRNLRVTQLLKKFSSPWNPKLHMFTRSHLWNLSRSPWIITTLWSFYQNPL